MERNAKDSGGLKTHQRLCRTVKSFSCDLSDDYAYTNHEPENAVMDEHVDTLVDECISLKPGVKLPKHPEDWELANSYFHTNLPVNSITKDNLDEVVTHFNERVYEYFKMACGTQT